MNKITRFKTPIVASIFLCLSDVLAFFGFLQAESFIAITDFVAFIQLIQVLAVFFMIKTMFACTRDTQQRRYYFPMLCYSLYLVYYIFMMFDAVGLVSYINGYDAYSFYRCYLRLAEFLLAVFTFQNAHRERKRKTQILAVLTMICNVLLILVTLGIQSMVSDRNSAAGIAPFLCMMMIFSHIYTGIRYSKHRTKGDLKGTLILVSVICLFFVSTIGNYFLYRRTYEDVSAESYENQVVSTSIPITLNHDSDLKEQIEAFLDANSQKFSGAVAVSVGEEAILEKAYGQADRSTDRDYTTNEVFPIISSTGQFAAVAIYQLQEEGKLDIEDTLGQYFPEFTTGKNITITQLLEHTSGLENYETVLNKTTTVMTELYGQDSVFIQRNLQLKEEFFRIMNGYYLLSEPGVKYNLSKSDNYLLGLLIEKVSGESFHNYVTEHILEPLGMTHTYFTKGAMTTKGYTKSGEEYTRDKNESYYYSANGMYSTLDDLMTFQTALSSGSLLSQSSTTDLFTVNEITGHAKGWEVVECGDRSYTGDTGNVLVQFINQEYNIQIIAVFNSNQGEAVNPILDLEKALYDYCRAGGNENE